MTPDPPAPVRRGRMIALLLAGAVAVAGGRWLAGLLPVVLQAIQRLGGWAPPAFVGLYAVGTVTLMPCFLLTLASGALFGLRWGVVYTFAGSVLGAAGSFLIARYVLREAVARRAAQDPRFAAIDRALGVRGRWIAFLVRLSPAFPYVLVNYAFGATRLGFADYLLTMVGMLPMIAVYVYYGAVGGEVAQVVGGMAERPGGLARWGLLAAGVVATIAATTLIGRLVARALRTADGD